MEAFKVVIQRAEKRYLKNLLKIAPSNMAAARIAKLSRSQLFRLLDKHKLERIHAIARPD